MKCRSRYLAPVVVFALLCISGCAAIIGDSPQTQPTPTVTPTSRSDSLQSAQATASPPGVPAQLSLREVANRVRPAVVQVANQQQVRLRQSGRMVEETAGIGSGVIYDASGLILTNEHVVAGADSLVVALPDGRTFQGQVVGTDPRTDLAVLRISGQNLPVAPLGTARNLAVGDGVIAIGNALGLTGGPTVTQGIVSALGRSLEVPPSLDDRATPQPGAQQGGRFLFDLIQTDAPINPGNSGGPLVNLQAQVVGINTVVARSTAGGEPVEGIGFATSIDTAKTIADQLVASGRAVHPYLGVQYVPLHPALAAHLNAPVQRGAYAVSVDPDSPAARAGIQQNDIIVSAADQPVDDESSLARIVAQHKPGDTIPLTILRQGRRLVVQVTLAQQPTS